MDTPTQSDPVSPVNPPQDDGAVAILKRLGPAAILGGIAVAMPLLGSVLLFLRINVIGHWLRDHGMEGVIVYTIAFMVLAGVAFLPTYATAILGGWAFGFQVGAAAALVGFTGAATIGYIVGRMGSGDRVEKIIAEHAKWKIIRDALVGGSFFKTLAIVTLVRLPPNSPFAIANLVFAGVKTNPFAYVIGTAVGMAPRTLIYVYLASDLAQRLNADEVATARPPVWIFISGIVAAVVVLIIIGAVAQRALRHVTGHGRQA